MKNEHLGELIRSYSVLFRFSGTRKSNKNLILTITSFNVKLAFSTLFVLILQTGFAARCCFWLSANIFSIEQVCPTLVYTMCKEAWWKISIAANKAHFLQPMLLLKVRKCAVPPDHLRSKILFSRIGKISFSRILALIRHSG